MHRAALHIFCLYIALGPVYWLPGIAPVFVTGLKAGLFALAALLPLAAGAAARCAWFPGGKRGLLALLALLVALVPSAMLGDPDAGLYRVLNVCQIAAFLAMTGYFITRWSMTGVVRIIAGYFTVVVSLSLVAILAVPDVANPLFGSSVLGATGFGSKRTGWSVGLAFFVPWLFVVNARRLDRAGGVVALLNQLLVVGRTGLLASVLVLLARFVRGWRGLVAMSGLVVVLFVFVERDQFVGYFRIATDNADTMLTFDALNLASAGRLGQYAWALQEIAASPLQGGGIGNVVYEQTLVATWSPVIHNEWLRIAAESGVPAALVSIGFLLVLVWPNLRQETVEIGSEKHAARLAVIAGLVASMLEPSAFFGAFNNSAMLWFSVACCGQLAGYDDA